MALSYDEITRFDPVEFPFDRLVLDAIRQAVPALTACAQLSQLHEFVTPDAKRDIENAVYALFQTAQFQTIYDGLCAEIIERRFGGRARYQRIPSVRVQFPGAWSVNYHTDEWYGHGHNVNNYWLPLTQVSGSNSMYVVGEAKSALLIEEMRNKKLSILEMNKVCGLHSRALEMAFGEIYVFNAHMLHGTNVNSTAQTRVSFDFRMLPDGESPGVKDDSFFVSPKTGRNAGAGEPSPHGRAGIYFGRTATVPLSQKYQQLVCLRYASENGLAAQVLETELSGFEHFPNLHDMIEGGYSGQFEHLIIFSLALLPEDTAHRSRLIAQAKAIGLTLHFVVEDLMSPPDQALAPGILAST
jgi:hypothetical protein